MRGAGSEVSAGTEAAERRLRPESEPTKAQLEEVVRRTEERYRAVFEQAFEGIFLVAPSHAIVDVNESACRMLGYTRVEVMALKAQDVLHPDDVASIPIRFKTIAPGGVILSERRFVRKDRSVMHGELSTKHLLDGTFQVVVRDVTERKQVQAQLLLADRMASLGRLASGVAHEFNNPLAYIMLNHELLAKRLRGLGAQVRPDVVDPMLGALEHAREGVERMRQVVQLLHTFGRGDETLVGPVDVNAVLDRAIEIASLQVRRRARISRQYAPEASVGGNAFRLAQVFVNLLLNAADALRDDDGPNSEIAVRTRVRDDGCVVVEVHSGAPTVPPGADERIFDPFFSINPAGGGTGLGLSVSHSIVTSFGGTIACESSPEKGTTFRVVLLPPPSQPT